MWYTDGMLSLQHHGRQSKQKAQTPKQKAQRNEGSVALGGLLNTGATFYADLHLP